MVDTDDPPELTALNNGDSVRIYYTSKRSGNEVDRRGEVAFTRDGEDGPIVWVHVEQRDTLKHQYAVLIDATTTNGDPCVAAYSYTVAADTPNGGEPPKPNSTHVVQYEIQRSSLLGIVDRVMVDGINVNVGVY